jgi:hypothetical protein
MALAGAIPALLVLVVVFWSAGSGDSCPKADLGPTSPLITDASLSSWETGRRLYLFEIKQLTVEPKRWGPFVFDDCRDLLIQGCRLQVTHDALSSSLKDIGQTLLLLGRQSQKSALSAVGPNGPGHGDSQRMPLVGLPPRIEAQNFSCQVTFPGGQVLIISAGLATLDPPYPVLDLEGNVRVEAGATALCAEAACWMPQEERLLVLTPYTLCAGNQKRCGCNDYFSLAKGELECQRQVNPIVPTTPVQRAALTPAQLIGRLWRQGSGGSTKSPDSVMSGMLLKTLQARDEQKVTPLPGEGP